MDYIDNRDWPEYNAQLEGFIGLLSTYEPGLLAADYTTLHKRVVYVTY